MALIMSPLRGFGLLGGRIVSTKMPLLQSCLRLMPVDLIYLFQRQRVMGP